MNLLDMRTLLLGYGISNLICLTVVALLWRQYRRRFEGLGFWLADYALQFVALLLMVLRGLIPDLLSMTGGTFLSLTGTLLLYMGLERFVGRSGPQGRNGLLLAAFLLLNVYFVLVRPSLAARNILFSLTLLVLCSQCAWLMLRRVAPEDRAVTAVVGQVFSLFCLVNLVRIALVLAMPLGNDFLRSPSFETLLLMTYQMLFIVLTFSLVLMVNRRLFADLERDIAVRRQVEASLRLSEEKFSKAFQACPDAIVISRLRDGCFVEVNDGFCLLTGYTRQEALAGSTLSLGLWVKPEERERLAADLMAHTRVRNRAMQVRIKSGQVRAGLCSGEIIDIGGETHILAVVRDVSESDLTERILKLRLRLWEFAASHPIDRLMQEALDEIEGLTGSLIGFYHFVDEEQEVLTLQAWSTRTRNEFCKAQGEGMHYPIAQAGVWVDCLKERRPVIHNDYASLPHRKGLPDGHAAVIRELVVPTQREGRVVAILGVGNKPSAYDERDVELVSYIADLVWEIVVRKRNDEQIRSLNDQLAGLAMTEELTGLSNRRAFFLLGNEEMKKARRYQTPLTMIMLDIDRFKEVNDTHGHEAGDRVLQGVAQTIRETVRESDLAARLGGEELGVLLPNTPGGQATVLAERLRLAIEEGRCPTRTGEVRVSASLGVAVCGDEMADLDALLRLADAAMYEAKNRGRNRVVVLG